MTNKPYSLNDERKLFMKWAKPNYPEVSFAFRNGDYLYSMPCNLFAAFKAGRTVGKPALTPWLPIETAPKDETPIDLWVPGERGGRFTNYARVDLGKGNVFYDPVIGGRGCIRDSSHWMALPTPPTKENSDV